MKTYFKKITSLFLITLTLGLLGLGCKNPSAEEQASIRSVTLNYWTVFGDVQELQKFAAEYQKLRPHVTVNIRQIRYEEYDKLFTNALADDVGPDIISSHVRSLRKYQGRLSPMPGKVKVSYATIEGQYAKELVINTEEKAMPSKDVLRANYVSGVPEDVILGADVYGLPLSYDTMAIYYNKTLLDQSGIPTAPTNWDELVDAIKKSTKFDVNNNIIQSGIALGAGKNIDNSPDILALLMMQKKSKLTEGSSVIFHYGLDKNFAKHPMVETLNFYTDFAKVDRDVYSWNKDQTNAFESFVRNKSVFYFGYAYDYTRIKARNPQLALESIPLPQLDANTPVNIANYWVESVVKKSKNKDYAWDFIRFMTLPSNIKQYSEATKMPSPLREHITLQKDIPALAPFATQSLTAKNWYKGREWDTAKRAIQTLVDEYLLPYPEGIDEEDRDSRLILQAGRTVQQTM